jgi:hypothetical protein
VDDPHGSRDSSEDGVVRVVFHPDAKISSFAPPSVDDVPEWVTRLGRALLAGKAARWEATEAASADPSSTDPSAPDSRSPRAREIEQAWAEQSGRRGMLRRTPW